MTRVLGYAENEPPDCPRVDPRFHKWFCKELEQLLNTIFLLPRDHTKSTTAGVCRNVQRVLRVVNISIFLASRTLGRAKGLLGDIRQHLGNPVLTFLFPERLYVDPNAAARTGKTKWTNEEITVKRTRVRASDPTVWIAGVGKTITGSHPDEIVLDDIINEETVATEVQSSKVDTWWDYLQPIASTRCLFTILGTFYDDFDIYHKLLERIKQKLISFRVIQKPVEDSLEMTGEGKFLYSFYDAKLLLAKKKSIPSRRVFYNQYYNVTRTEEDKIFRMRYSTYVKFPGELFEYERYITVDPGFSKRTQADNTGICVCLYDKFNAVWVELARRYKLTVVELLDKLYELDEIYHADYIGIESGTWQDAIQDMFNFIVASENRKVLPIVPLKTGTAPDAKHKRIVGTAGYLDKGIVQLRTDKEDVDEEVAENYTQDLITEMYYYSASSRQKDDVLDAFAMQKLVHEWGEIPEEEISKTLSAKDAMEEWRLKHDTYASVLKQDDFDLPEY